MKAGPRLTCGLLPLLLASTAAPAGAEVGRPAAVPVANHAGAAEERGDPLKGTTALAGLFPVNIAADGSKVFLTLPRPGTDGVAARFLYTPSLRSGLGAAPTMLDRGRTGQTQLLAFRRVGAKLAIEFENPRFRNAVTAGAANPDFATSIVWMEPIVRTAADGAVVVDIASFLASDVMGIAQALGQENDAMGIGAPPQGAGSGFRIDDKLSAAAPGSARLFPRNFEIDAVQTYASDKPGAEVGNIAPESRRVSFTVHHSFVALPPPGFVPRPFDPRVGGFPTQIVDYGVPLGRDVVRDVANRFRIEKLDPAAPRSRVRQPIVFYLDRSAPEPMRGALLEGIAWWGRAFDAAGYVDAFRAELLPEGVDPLDVRYNVVNWVDRATRGWSYGQEIVDPRTGEIVKGMVVLGAERVRQDIQIFQGLVGADAIGRGGPNDPVRAGLARLRQLGAHEVGHALGFAHNFAASTQDRASVMDYPPPRIALVDGRPDLSDAYGVGVGRWDLATVAWLYGEPAPGADRAAALDAAAAAPIAQGLRFTPDDNARRPDTAQPWAGLWDDGDDPVAELGRMMRVRDAAIARFGLPALAPGEPVANLRRRFVPIYLLHRYQLVAAAKSIGGVDFSYAVNGGGREAAAPLPAGRQRAAIAAVLDTLAPERLRVPATLLPLLSAARNGSEDRQFEIELFQTAGGTVFDPLVAADVAAQIAFGALLAPSRLARLELQHAAEPGLPGVTELLDAIDARTVEPASDPLGRRVAYRAIVAMAQAARRGPTAPDVALLLGDRVHAIATRLRRERGDAANRAWSAQLSRQLLDPASLELLLKDRPRVIEVPPGEPIGAETEWMGAAF